MDSGTGNDSGASMADARTAATGDAMADAATSGTDAATKAPDTDAATNTTPAPDDDAGLEPMPCEPSPIADYCSEIPALPRPPVIDGALDCGVEGRPLETATWNGVADLPADHRTLLAVAHRPQGLYVHVQVRGQPPVPHPPTDPIYCGDAVELYVDADAVVDADGAYDEPGTMQLIIAAPASEAMPDPHAERFVRGSTQGPWETGRYAIRWLSDGYAVEAFVQAADLGLDAWPPGDRIGVDVAIGVSGAADDPELRCGRLLGQYFLRVGTGVNGCESGEPWCSAAAFCTPMLR